MKFEAGTDVAQFCGFDDQVVYIKKVAKVYANGNFVLHGDSQQWRPGSNGMAMQTGPRYGRSSVHLLTPAVLEKIRKTRLRERWVRAVGKIVKINGKEAPEHAIAALESVVALLSPETTDA